MKKLTLLTASLLTLTFATAQTGTDYMKALKVADTDIIFDINDEGKAYHINWGMDAAWDWDYNVYRGIAHIGKGNFETGRVSFQPNDLVTDNGDGAYTLSARQQKRLKWRCDLIKETGTKKVNLNCDHEALFKNENGEEDFTGRKNYQGKPEEWYKLIKATAQYVQKQGLTVISVSPFNEPDFVWEQATSETQAMKDFLAIAKLIKEDPFFKDIRVSGGNTLNSDRALPWYNYLKEYIDEGNTHQLAGSFDTYAGFFAQVKADGRIGTADELHNVGEAIVGANYGMENGIWWGFDSKARGQFCIDSNEGVRIGYGENRNAWTDAAVYRNEKTGEVHGYIGSSERQASSSSFAFISTTKDVYFNGYGPTRMYVYDVPGGTGYQKGQINAERLFDITWGEDVAPFEVNGTYQILNVASKKLLTMSGGNATSSTRKSSGKTQQWNVYPGYTDGDMSYWFFDNAGNTNMHLNTELNWGNLKNMFTSSANVIVYSAGTNHPMEEQWYIKYAQEGSFYIINRLTNKYLYCSSLTDGTRISSKNEPDSNTSESELKKYLWRFLPTDVKTPSLTVLKAPEAPTALYAKQRNGSIELNWTAPADDDVASYTILRAEEPAIEGGLTEYNTIGRNDTLTTFIDNTVIAGKKYIYKVQAVDYHCNRSEASDTLHAAPLAEQGLVCQLQFDGNTDDCTPNSLNASLFGTASYSSVSAMIKSGTKSLNMKGDIYAMLPYAATHHDEMTITTWVRHSSGGSNWQRIFDFGNGTNQYMFLTPNNGSEMRFVMKNGGEEEILSTGKKLSTTAWHHIAIAIKPMGNNVQATLYLDGENVAQSDKFTIKPSDIAPSLCYIGRSMFRGDPLFEGRIDDFRIYNHALSADEIAAIMTDIGEVSNDISNSYEETLSTDIQAIHPDNGQQTTDNDALYDLSGRHISTPANGIVIQGKKKILYP